MKKTVFFALSAFLILSWLTVSAAADYSGDEIERYRLGGPSATPSSTPRPGSIVQVREGAPPNALRGFSTVGGGGGGVILLCDVNSDAIMGSMFLGPVSSDYQTIASGETVTLVDLSLRIVIPGMINDQLPTICSPDPVSRAYAVTPEGIRIRAMIQPSGQGFAVQLPLEAFQQPGLWQLVVANPAFYEIWIKIPSPTEPFYLDVSENSALIGGFAPFEAIKGIFFNGDGFVADFDVRADENGYVPLHFERYYGMLYAIGQSGNALVPIVFDESTSLLASAGDNINREDAIRLLYTTYWGGEEAFTCPNSPPSRLIGYSQARVLPNIRSRIYSQPEGRVRGLIPAQSVFAIIGGPVCGANTGLIWWEVNYSGQRGWTTEGRGEEYWLEPVTE